MGSLYKEREGEGRVARRVQGRVKRMMEDLEGEKVKPWDVAHAWQRLIANCS